MWWLQGLAWVGWGHMGTHSLSQQGPAAFGGLSLPRLGEGRAKQRWKWSAGQAGALQGLKWAPARGVLFQGDPNLCQPSRAQVRASHKENFCLENLTRKTQNPVQEGGAAAKGGAAGLGSSRNCWKREFPRKKASKPKSQAEAQGLAGGLALSRVKATSQVPFPAALAAPRPSLGVALRAGIAEQRAEPRPGASPAAGYTCTHKQGKSQLAAWQPPAHLARALSAQLAPGTPHSASSRHAGVSFGFASL